MHCKKEENIKDCNCTYYVCTRRGLCCDCIKYHRDKNELPACYFDKNLEKTYNRSVTNFIKNKK